MVEEPLEPERAASLAKLQAKSKALPRPPPQPMPPPPPGARKASAAKAAAAKGSARTARSAKASSSGAEVVAKAKAKSSPAAPAAGSNKRKMPALRTMPSQLFKRGKVDKKVVRRATEMTREEWLQHQEGMDAKWPLPAYMNGQKGHNHYKDETYSIVTCWTANTRIRYRPHAKAPGSKSHLRYERYSQAKTVGEALEMGTYPSDWCWDYERGFLKVIGGTLRDEPLDITSVAEGELTPVDLAIHTWHKRELAKKYGVKVSDLSTGQGESATMRGERLLAQKAAKDALEAADKEGRGITDEEVLSTLKQWAFSKTAARQNVLPPGQECVLSDTLGLSAADCQQGSTTHLTAATRRYPQVAELIARWLTERMPDEARDFKFTSMHLNSNYAARMHRDEGNLGPCFIRAFGDFEGGELQYWPEDAGGALEFLPEDQREVLDVKEGLTLLNGNCAHAVEDFTGNRYSVVYFTTACHAQMSDDDRAKLQQMGFPTPAANEDAYKLLRPPQGYKGALGKSAGRETPGRGKRGLSWKFWPSSELKVKKKVGDKFKLKKEAAMAARRRLAPENKRGS